MKNASTVSEDTASNQEPTLHRGLHNRHIQLIALGGAIGTGLFLGIGPAIQMAGPAVLLGYGVAGIIAFLIMRQLGEMVVEEPVSGSFAHFAYKRTTTCVWSRTAATTRIGMPTKLCCVPGSADVYRSCNFRASHDRGHSRRWIGARQGQSKSGCGHRGACNSQKPIAVAEVL